MSWGLCHTLLAYFVGRRVRQPGRYEGDDPVLLAAIAVVVHGLADRAQIPLPDWVLCHRAPEDVMLFAGPFDTPYSRMVRWWAPAGICAHHRVWFHHRLLDKGHPGLVAALVGERRGRPGRVLAQGVRG